MRSLRVSTALPLLLALANPVASRDFAHRAVEPTKTAAPARRWKTDVPLRDGMGRIQGAVEGLQHYEHGHMGPEQATQLAKGITRDVIFIVANCKLEPRADAALHPIIAALMKGAQALDTRPTDLAAIPPMHGALRDYARQFDDPGFAALAQPE
jgi:hypothetical protein